MHKNYSGRRDHKKIIKKLEQHMEDSCPPATNPDAEKAQDTQLADLEMRLSVVERGEAGEGEGIAALADRVLALEAGGTGGGGPKGDKGDKGDTGDKGDKGETGAIGPQGDVGAEGPQGPSGAAGVPGPAGAVGPTGETGLTGAPGPAGPLGPVGPQGEVGAVGPSGPTGAPGVTGPAGPQGEKGDTGEPGSAADVTALEARVALLETVKAEFDARILVIDASEKAHALADIAISKGVADRFAAIDARIDALTPPPTT